MPSYRFLPLWLVFLLCISFLSVHAQTGEQVNLALAPEGGMPSASASAPNMAYSAQKACDGDPATGWLSTPGVFPVWLRVEWMPTVTVEEIVIIPLPAATVAAAGPVGEHTVEVSRNGRWHPVARGDGDAAGADGGIRHVLPEPVRTDGVRVVIHSSSAAQVGIGELQVLGPKTILPGDWAPHWQARWIWPQPSLLIAQRQPIRRYFRRSFELADPAQVAEAWIMAGAFDRLNSVMLNSRPLPLSHGSLQGGLFPPTLVHRLPEGVLQAGENVLAISVDDVHEVGSQGLLAELVIVFNDGERLVIATDNQWRGHEDQGVVPQWREPGFNDANWVNCTVGQSPNGSRHWAWHVPYPNVAPKDRLEVVGLAVAPEAARPGESVTVTLSLRTDEHITRDYALAVRLGHRSLQRSHDYELWGAFLPPEQVRSSQWGPGTHEVSIEVPIPHYALTVTQATVVVSVPEAGVGLSTSLTGCSADMYGLHFTIPVDRGHALHPAAPADFPESVIVTREGNPQLEINGEPTAPILWSSAYGNYRRYDAYAATGIKLFRPILPGGPIAAPGEEEEYFAWWFTQVDEVFHAALYIDPKIMLLPTVTMDPSPQWLFDNPAEQMIGGRASQVIPLSMLVPDRGQVRPTFMSHGWRAAGADGLQRLVLHMRSQPYAANIIGLCFFAGRAGENYWGGNERNIFINEAGQYDAKAREEWEAGDFSMAARLVFREWLIERYGTEEALRRAWKNPEITFDAVLDPRRFDRTEVCDILVGSDLPDDHGSVRDPLRPGVGTLPMDYNRCYSEAMADSFAAWGRAVKEASDNRLLTGCYYGYALAQMFTSVPGFHGHTAVDRANRSPWLDFFVSPSEYDGSRRAGGHFWGHNITDSLRLHNKLWLYEQDTRTYLADIMPKTFTREETLEVVKRDSSASLVKNTGWWWYEFSTGQRGAAAREWFKDPDFAELADQLKRLYDFSLTLPERGPSAQIAVFFHGETLTAQDLFSPTPQLNISSGRLTLINQAQRIGAPFDLYNLADISLLAERDLLSQYRLCIMLNSYYLSAEELASLELLKGDGRTVLWLWAPGLAHEEEGLSVERVAALTGIPGIRIREQRADQAYRITAEHPVTAGIAPGTELRPTPFGPGSAWERFGNAVWPLVYVDPAVDDETEIVGKWVIDGQKQEDMGALSVRTVSGERGQWTSIHSAIAYLTADLLRNIARTAGVHIYRDGGEVLFAGRHFVALHTGSEPAGGELRLPAPTTVYDVFGDAVVGTQTDSVAIEVPPYTTALYYLGDPAALQAALAQ